MNNSSKNYNFIFKILLLGDSAVGKTCFLLRYSDDTFCENHISTIGLDYRFKLVTLENEKIAKLQIWDTAGQDRFRAITKNYYKGANGIVLIYDVTNANTFNNIKAWLSQIKEHANEKVKIVIVGNKIDSEETRQVSTEQGEALAKEYDLKFFETSAKNNIGVEQCFQFIVNEIYEQSEKTNDRRKSKADGISLDGDGENKGIKKPNCCK